MEFINNILLKLTPAARNILYNTFGYAMYAVFVLIFLLFIKMRRIKFRSVLPMLTAFVLAFLIAPQITTVLNAITKGLIPNRNLGVSFLVFLPIFCMLLILFKFPVDIGLDTALPMYIGGRGICIIGCIFPGCCHGFAAERGIYSHSAKMNTVPCPLIDSAFSILIAFILIYMSRQNKAKKDGRIAAFGCTAFGILRYVIDVLRDNEKLFSMVTFEGLCGIVTVVIGLTALYLLNRKEKQITMCEPVVLAD